MVEIFSEGETKYISEVSKRRDLDGRGDGEGRERASMGQKLPLGSKVCRRGGRSCHQLAEP